MKKAVETVEPSIAFEEVQELAAVGELKLRSVVYEVSQEIIQPVEIIVVEITKDFVEVMRGVNTLEVTEMKGEITKTMETLEVIEEVDVLTVEHVCRVYAPGRILLINQ
ncbi:hypothetical protein ACDT12_13415, partial [Staphylococcus aureus]